MTVSYQYDVASSTSGGFTRLLFKWRGSLYKLIYKELGFFTIAYVTISLTYRFLFTEDQKRSFEKVSVYCDTLMTHIPLSFILGFYVSFVASRWWQQYIAIPWPDKMLHTIALYVIGEDEQGRILRRTLVRYLNLSLVLVLRSISSAVKKRFPTLDHLVDAGFITKVELDQYNLVPKTEFNTYWVPCTWFTALLKDAKTSKRIVDSNGLKLIMEEFCDFRQKCGLLWSYDWVSIPLVYTQVVTIATYAFFMASIVGRQFVEQSPLPHKHGVDIFIPFFTLLQYFFYMGLLKVAEQLINPFGDDDEDFELNWIIDRHMKVSYLIVDTLMDKNPVMSKDMFFDDTSIQLPYTEASALFKRRTYLGSVVDMVIPEKEQNMILPDIQEEEEEQTNAILRRNGKFSCDYESRGVTPSPCATRRGSGTGSKSKNKKPTKGIGSALLTVGHHQGFLATYPEKLTDSAVESERNNDKLLNEMDYFVLPVKDYTLDIDGISYEDETSKQKKLHLSNKAKTAVKKKPVIKWKPYKRPSRLDEMPYSISDDSTPPPGMFEEETAFMWRTIDHDDTDSLQTAISGISCDQRGDIVHADGPMYSHYNTTKPTKNSIESHSSISSRLKHRRLRRSLTRPSYISNKLSCSWPYLYKANWSHRTISPNLFKSISDASIFLDCLSSQMRNHKRHSTTSSYNKTSVGDKREQFARSSVPDLNISSIS